MLRSAFAVVRAVREERDELLLAPGLYEFDEPLALPDRPVSVRGAGVGLTELRFHGEGVDGIVARRGSLSDPVSVRDLTISTSAKRGGTALAVSMPDAGACHDPSLVVDSVRIKPLPNEFAGAWRRGVVLDGCWNPTLSRVWVQGQHNDQTPSQLADAHMEVAVDVGGSQEAKVSQLFVACARVGLRVDAPAQGKGEGLSLDHSAFVNAEVGVRASGGVFGGWPVPWLHVSSTHFFTTTYGVFATGRSGVVLDGNDFCGSHFSPWAIGVFLADRCRNIRVLGNNFWTTRAGQGHAVVIDNSEHGVIADNTIDRSVQIGAWLTRSSRGIRVRGNENNAALPVANDAGSANRVEG